ncbi:MAG: hypothetical protein MUE42_00700 [Opitutaceae bacterium]|jgi:hypothetical protein|nr:hypothetical protein [Opitutaceae bacterium]
MSTPSIAPASASASSALSPLISGGFVNAFGGRYYRIAHSDRMPPFFMNVVSSSDLWMFAASTGSLSAGRIDAERALFPYQTVDRIYDSAGQIGPYTALRVHDADTIVDWEPFAAHTARLHPVERHLYKSLEGDRVWYEESHLTLGLVFRYGWASSEAHGWVRTAELVNTSGRSVSLRLIDGLRNLHVPGVSTRLQAQFSNLADAYKAAELEPASTLGVYALASGIVDQAIPMESLRATAVWSHGLAGADILLSDAQLGAFHRDEAVSTEARRRGLRGHYLLHAARTLAPGETLGWMIVADTNLTQADVAARLASLRADSAAFAAAVRAGADESTRRLRALVGAADGIQTGGDEIATAHHFANVLFNLMRGGVFIAGHQVDGADFADFVRTRNRPVATRHAAFLAGLPELLPHDDLMARIAALGDADLERLGWELLPLTFSRRHGDPSRPWNKFSIRLRDGSGRRLLNHEGNWRDIFQNWEALCTSHPAFIESVVAKFLNASTADGFNPYRITRAGIEWEKPEPEDPWASIGYWGDHQVVYLLRLLEWSARFHPGRLSGWLRRELFAYADVPYRISGYDEMRANPRSTIRFDRHHDELIERRVSELGTDGRLLPASDGAVLHVNLVEKLLVLVLARLTHFIPGGGIWMNTQRPEWNDANNALVGYGVSVVTTGHLRRLLTFMRDALATALGDSPVPVSSAVARLLADVVAALRLPALASAHTDSFARRTVVDALATAGSDYRASLYAEGPGSTVQVAPAAICTLLDRALSAVDATLRANRRADGLFHSYNLLAFSEPASLEIQHLAPMLEGQVSILGAGLLTPTEAEALLGSLRRSPLHRADQHSYLLYPDRELPGFLARNLVPAALVAANPLLTGLLAAGDTRLVLRDAAGDHRFHPDLVNSGPLEARLSELASEPRWAALAAAHADDVRAIYERVFNHRAFTGRSGGMFGFEGLGCIYWHMVSKLLLSAQENLLAARAANDPAAPALAARYFDVRNGLGPAKSPAVFGAFPTDPYSHTPGHSGAQQPGMTGQVKEEILTRLGELGVQVTDGCLAFEPTDLPETEFTREPAVFAAFGADGREFSLPLPAHSLGFTVCGTPVVYTRGARPFLRIQLADGTVRTATSRRLDAASSAAVFARDGSVKVIEVTLGADSSGSASPLPFAPAGANTLLATTA